MKNKSKIFLSIISIAFFCGSISCVKSDMPDHLEVPAGFDWKMINRIFISIPNPSIDEYLSSYATTVKIYDDSTFAQRYFLASGAVFKNKPFDFYIDRAICANDSLYVELKCPNDSIIRQLYIVNGSVAQPSKIIKTYPKSLHPVIVDNDNDGIVYGDDYDDNDPNIAFVSYFPHKDIYGSYAFEDRWPQPGNFDMNDAVIDYKIVYYSNSENMVNQLDYNWTLRAVGSIYKISAAFILQGVTPDMISDVYYSNDANMSNFPINRNNRGMESEQAQAVFTLFNDPSEQFGIGVNTPINTIKGSKINTLTYNYVRIKFVNAIPISNLGADIMDTFIVISKDKPERGREVHLAKFPPTDLADMSLLKNGNVESENNPYMITNGMVWAYMFPTKFRYPVEAVNISKVYLKYNEWYTSGGTAYKDWYILDNKENIEFSWLY